MAYGILSILMSFVVGKAGTVLQASISLVGSMIGPLFAIFSLGIFYPYATEAAALIGFVLGITVSLILSIGSLVISRPKVSLPTTLKECPVDVLRDHFLKYNTFLNSSFVTSYEPKDFAKVFHISYLLLPIVGFIICLTVGALLSHCVGKPNPRIDPKLMSPFVRHLIPDKHLGSKDTFRKCSSNDSIEELNKNESSV